jgi:nucleotide-binding universal stress UspA family protein
MKRFSHILACTDFSEPGDRAVRAAFGLCSDKATSVWLMHVLDAPPTPNPMYASYYPSKYWDPEEKAAAESEARKGLQGLIPAEAQRVGMSVELLLGHGQPVEEIIRVAEEKQIDIIVVGTQGRTGLSHLLLGSVAERVVRIAECPVLVVR